VNNLLKEAQESVADSFKHSLGESLQPQSVEQNPSPHFYGHNVFANGFFDCIRAHLPESKFYGGVKGRTGNVRAQKSRLALPMKDDNISQLPGQLRPFWSEATTYFQSSEFLSLAISAYQPFLKEVRPDLINHSRFDIRFELLRDTTAYGIGPHADHPNKVMTLLFYLSGGETSEALGTSFYIPKQSGFKCGTGLHHDNEKFNLYKTYPYAPNTVLSFLRTDTSFHGVEVIEEENVQRDVLRWMLWKA
jgi:hypothetical protein